MKLKYSFLLVFSMLLSIGSFSQTNCDSLQIDCCNLQLLGNDTISLIAINISTQEIFDYPGFILLAQNGDTLAKETVNYFGIGWGGQTHYMNVQNPITLPIQGTLELWGLFYDTLYCSYPFTINAIELNENWLSDFIAFPNPVSSTLHLPEIQNGHCIIYGMNGKIVISRFAFNNYHIDMRSLSPGEYIIEIESEQGKIRRNVIKE